MVTEQRDWKRVTPLGFKSFPLPFIDRRTDEGSQGSVGGEIDSTPPFGGD